MKTRTALPWDQPGRDVDLELLQHALQRGLPGCADGQIVIDGLRLLKARRSSSLRRNPHPLTVWMEAELREPGSGRIGVQRLYGKAFRDGAAAQALAAAREHARTPAAFLEPVMHLPELDMLLWSWPNDPTLEQLPRLLDPATAGEHLPRDPARGTEVVVAQEVLRYEPEQRATLRYSLRAKGQAGLRVIYGKTFADDRAATLQQRFEHFWHAAAEDDAAPLVAEPLGVDGPTRTLWQAAARGVPLMERVRQEQAPADFAAVGRALTRVHRAPLATRSERGLGHWLEELQRRRTKIGRAAPELAERAEAVAARLEHAAAQLPAATPRLLHGDFHPDQIWIDGHRVVLFDFDEFCIGHPMEDLSAFVVKLEQSPLPRARCTELVAALVGGYRSEAGADWCPVTLAWYRALQSLLQASRAFIFQAPGWQADLATRLARSERLVEEIGR